MAWVRLDDRFAEHPKVLALRDADLRVHINALCYTARARDPHITPGALRPLGATTRHAERLVEAGLWDNNSDGWVIHDWSEYQPASTSAERMKRKRQRDNGVTGE